MATYDRPPMIGPTIIGSIRRFHRIVLLTTGLALFAALVYVLVAPSEYAGTASIILQPPPASLTVGLSTTHLPNATYQGQQVAIIESPQVAAGAAAIVNSKFPDAHVTATQMQNSTTVKLPTPGTSGSNGAATKITVTLPSSTYAPAGANAVIASYLNVQRNDIRQQARNSTNAINTQIAKTTAQLQAIPAPSSNKTTTSTPSGSTSHTPTTVVRPPRTTTTRPAHVTTTRPARATTTTTRAPRSTTTTTSNTSTSASAAVGGSAHAQLTSFGPSGSPIVLTADTTSSSTTTTTAPVPGGTGSSTGSSGSSGSSSNANSAQERAALLSTLSTLNRSKAQVAVNEQNDLAFAPTIFPATAPGTSANGNYLRTLLIALVIGLLIGTVIAFVLATTRRRFERATDPQQVYNVPLITTIPAFAVPAWTRVALPILTAPTDEAAEAYRTLATVLRARRGNGDCLVVSFSAADLGSGTTTTVANCGLALAEMGERALAIDGDPLGRGLTQTLVEDGEMDFAAPPVGLTELLDGHPLEETIVPALGNTGLMVVPSGRNTDVAIHRWRSSIMRSALENLTQRFDVILLDTPPMGTSSFSLDLAGIAEHLVLTIPHYDLIELHDGIARRLPMVGIELLGYVYNGTPASIRFAPYFPVVRGPRPPPLEPGPTPLRGPEPSLHSAPAPAPAPAPSPIPTGTVTIISPEAEPSTAKPPETAAPTIVPTAAEAPTGQVAPVVGADDDTMIVPAVPEADDPPTSSNP